MRVYCLFILCLISFSVSATSGWTGYGNIIELVPTIHHRFAVHVDVKGNKSDCKAEQWFYQDYNITGAREMYLALLEAVSSNKTVRFYVTGRCNTSGYSEISELGIRP